MKVIVSRNKYGSEAVTPPEDLLSEPLTAMVPIQSININYNAAVRDDGPSTESVVSTNLNTRKNFSSSKHGPSNVSWKTTHKKTKNSKG